MKYEPIGQTKLKIDVVYKLRLIKYNKMNHFILIKAFDKESVSYLIYDGNVYDKNGFYILKKPIEINNNKFSRLKSFEVKKLTKEEMEQWVEAQI